MTNGAAIEWLRSRLGIELAQKQRAERQTVATYDYRDEHGGLLFQVCRFEPKTFQQRRPDGRGGWIWKVKGTRQVPHRLPELIATPADCVAFVVEGEKDADRLTSLGLVVTCNPGGAGKWRSDFNVFFQGRDVAILPDNDDTGRDHARSVAMNLAPLAARIQILELPGLPPKGDVSDWLDAGGTREELERLAAGAPMFLPEDGAAAAADLSSVFDDEAEIARLAKLRALQYDRERQAAAERLGCRVATLDEAVADARSEGGAVDSSGRGRPLGNR
jgi:putative DNA primase/helicase